MQRLCIKTFHCASVLTVPRILRKELNANLKCLTHTINRHSSSKAHDVKLERVYYGPLTPQIRAVKVFSITSSLAGLIAQPIIIKEAATIGSTSLIVALCSVVGFFTFVTPILLHIITKKYVTEIHYDPITSTYKATTISFLLTAKQLDFKVEDIEVPDIPGMFTTLLAKKQPLFIEARHFNNPQHYAKMMGYDKPMDFKLGENTEGSTSDQSK